MMEVWEAIEATAINRSPDTFAGRRASVTKHEINLHRKTLLAFLEEIDGDMTVSELREAIESYRSGDRHD